MSRCSWLYLGIQFSCGATTDGVSDSETLGVLFRSRLFTGWMHSYGCFVCAQYEGVSRMQTSLKRRHRDRVVRRGAPGWPLRTAHPRGGHWPWRQRVGVFRGGQACRTVTHLVATHLIHSPTRQTGLGMMIESDFYATDAGRKHFADQLTSIRYCVQETCSTRRK